MMNSTLTPHLFITTYHIIPTKHVVTTRRFIQSLLSTSTLSSSSKNNVIRARMFVSNSLQYELEHNKRKKSIVYERQRHYSTLCIIKNQQKKWTVLQHQIQSNISSSSHRVTPSSNIMSNSNNNSNKENTNTPVRDNATSSNSANFIQKYLPKSIQPYAHLARLDKPIGTMLLLWPCWWSTALASSPVLSIPSSSSSSFDFIDMISQVELSSIIGDPKLLALFTLGSFIMRGAGCTINDMWDAKYDAQVHRTSTRPIASGILTHRQAAQFLAFQLFCGLGVLMSLQPHVEYCFQIGVMSLPLVGIYPFMKRIINFPQLVLGFTFNWGAWMGWAATHGDVMAYNGVSVILPLYLGGVAWTLVYDTLYAHQDKKDDKKLGLKSTALYFGDVYTKPILVGCSSLATASWMLAGYNLGFIEPYYYIGCGVAGMHMLWQVTTADLEDDVNLSMRFKSNNVVGGIVFLSCMAGNLAATASV